MFVVGVCLAWLALAFGMKTTVWTGGETIRAGEFSTYIPRQEVYNLGLVERRRNHLMLAGVGLLAGTMLIGFGAIAARKGDRVPCPECAEWIRSDASKCRYCGAVLPSLDETETNDDHVKQALSDELGIVKKDGRYYFRHLSFHSLDNAITYAKSRSSESA
jgi:hypothetical protein